MERKRREYIPKKISDYGQGPRSLDYVPDRFTKTGVIMGQFVSNRLPEDQGYVLRIANQYLRPNEREILMKLLGYREFKNLEFNYDEAQVLISRANPAFLTGVRQKREEEGIGFPFLQLYDFIFSFDDVMSRIRGLQVQVNNMDDLGDVANKQLLRAEIMSESGLPWTLYDYIRNKGKATRIVNKENKNKKQVPVDEYTGFQIGSTHIYEADPNHADAVDYIREKNGYEKACDEAMYLSFPVQKTIVALGQGLFGIHITTNAKMWSVSGGAVMNKEGAGQIPMGGWINAFTGNDSYCFTPKQYKFTDASNKYHGLGLLQTKYDTIKNYPYNQFAEIHAKVIQEMTNDSIELYGHNLPGTMDSTWNAHRHNGLGGPIGQHIFVLTSDRLSKVITSTIQDSEKSVVEEEGKERKEPVSSISSSSAEPTATSAEPTEAESKPSDIYCLPQAKLTMEAPTRSLRSVGEWMADSYDMKTIRRVMLNQYDHPIFACPRLAAAWEASKAWQYCIDHWNRLRRLFTAKQKTTTLGERVDNMESAMRIEENSVQLFQAKPICEKGFINVFRNYQGEVVPLEKAVYLGEDNKLKVNTAVVDPKQSTCTPELDAPRLPENLIKQVFGADVARKADQPPPALGGKSYGDTEPERQRSSGKALDLFDELTKKQQMGSLQKMSEAEKRARIRKLLQFNPKEGEEEEGEKEGKQRSTGLILGSPEDPVLLKARLQQQGLIPREKQDFEEEDEGEEDIPQNLENPRFNAQLTDLKRLLNDAVIRQTDYSDRHGG